MEKSEQQKEAQALAFRLVNAYRAVLGVEGNRTEAQRLVYEDMRARSAVDSPIFLRDERGALCPLRAAIAEGRRLNFLQLEAILKKSFSEEKPEPTVKT